MRRLISTHITYFNQNRPFWFFCSVIINYTYIFTFATHLSNFGFSDIRHQNQSPYANARLKCFGPNLRPQLIRPRSCLVNSLLIEIES